jgi:hypothetical protein
MTANEMNLMIVPKSHPEKLRIPARKILLSESPYPTNPSNTIIVNATATPTAMRAWNFEERNAPDGFSFHLIFILQAATPVIPARTRRIRHPIFLSCSIPGTTVTAGKSKAAKINNPHRYLNTLMIVMPFPCNH